MMNIFVAKMNGLRKYRKNEDKKTNDKLPNNKKKIE